MSLADDLDSDLDNVFFKNADEFNALAVFTLKKSGGAKLSVFGLFSDEAIDLQGDGQLSVTSSVVEFTVKTTAIKQVRFGDSVLISNIVYRVIKINPEGVGVTSLLLEKQDIQF